MLKQRVGGSLGAERSASHETLSLATPPTQVHVKPKPESGSTNGAIAKERGSAARRGSKQLEKAQAPAWVLRSIAETSVARLLDAADTWDFDVFAFAEATCMHPLVVGGLHLFQRMGLLDRVGVPRDRLANYLLAVERGYIGTNPFHNQLHAADVMFTTYYQLQVAPNAMLSCARARLSRGPSFLRCPGPRCALSDDSTRMSHLLT